VDLLTAVFPLIAWTVCILLFLLQLLFGAVFTFSLLGHLAQLVFSKVVSRAERK
jgi:hypothetical protein